MKIIRTSAGCLSSYGFIHKLQTRGIKVIGIDMNKYSSCQKFCDGFYVVPAGYMDTYIPKLLEICEIEKPDMIIAGAEEELISISKHKKLFDDISIKLLLPSYETISICSNKMDLYHFFRYYAIPTPHCFKKYEDIVYPCIIKPIMGRGGKDIKIIERKTQDNKIYHTPRVITQEFIEDGIEYSIDCFSDNDGTPLSIIPRIRLRTESGISVFSITRKNDILQEYCKKIVSELKIYGASCIQCIENNDGFYFIDVNCRFGGGSILSVEANPKIIDYIIDIIKDKPLTPDLSFKDNIVMARYYSEFFFKENSLHET